MVSAFWLVAVVAAGFLIITTYTHHPIPAITANTQNTETALIKLCRTAWTTALISTSYAKKSQFLNKTQYAVNITIIQNPILINISIMQAVFIILDNHIPSSTAKCRICYLTALIRSEL